MAHEKQFQLFTILLLILNRLAQQAVEGSGVFEINFSSLVDDFGRDLRDDCCSWQNYSSLQPPHNNHLHQSTFQQANQHQLCDPTKCQLIIRICVKNYQTQIDPNQCTFGELSAQVVKPNEPAQFAHYPNSPLSPIFSPIAASTTNSNKNLNILSPQSHHQLANKRLLHHSGSIVNNGQATSAANIHHQRMLYQQQYQAPFLQQQSRYQPQYYRNPAGFLSSGQPRAMRTITFQQPISFPFNFTWPVSSRKSVFSLLPVR